MKYFNFKRYKFSTIFKNINFKRYNFTKIFNSIDFKALNFKRIYKYTDLERYDFKRIKKINFTSSKFLFLHLPLSIAFFGFLYLFIPVFYSYDKSNIENFICENRNIKCVIRGKVNYDFFPTPRIKIKDLVISDINKKNILITSQETEAKLSFKNLLSEDQHKIKEININNYEINFNLKDLKKYKSIYKKNNLLPINFEKGKIIFLDEKNYIGNIDNAKVNLKTKKNFREIQLKGKFLNDDIYLSLVSKTNEEKPSNDFILKMSKLNFLVKANFKNNEKNKKEINGNILLRKDKHRFTGFFNYKNDEITIDKSNLRNAFLDGKLEGKIKLLPFFDFDLDLSLNSLNFTKLYNNFLSLGEKKQANFFKFNKKFNGKLSLSSERIYSSYNLVKSFESRIKFNNGDILLEQCLFNLGKLGAADILGVISNEKKFTNFKYESNVFVDNQKKFLSKFGIYNKKDIFSDLFVSGSFDLKNIKNTFYEISDKKELNENDINFIEKEFNDIMLSDGYTNLFFFPKFKEFIKTILVE
tara:strand:+ start:1196 stop:2779 length:1584 start_codon:yes stop_codon:yes gene_type:complete